MKKYNVFIMVMLLLSLLINIYWGYYFFPHWFPHEVNIPNNQQVINYCQDQGYKSGWLDSQDCKENQVKCYKYVLDMVKYICIDWNSSIRK